MQHSPRFLKSAIRATMLVAACAGLAAVLIPASAGSAAAASSGYTVSLVPVAASGSNVAIDPVTGTLYVTNGSGEQLIVVDGATGTVEATLSLGHYAGAVAVDPTTDVVYVAGYVSYAGAASVVVVNGSTNTVAATISEPTDSEPEGIAVNSTTGTVYVANYAARNVTVIDGATNAITATVSTGSTSLPYKVAVDDSSDVVWVADWTGRVIAIDDADGARPPAQGPQVQGWTRRYSGPDRRSRRRRQGADLCDHHHRGERSQSVRAADLQADGVLVRPRSTTAASARSQGKSLTSASPAAGPVSTRTPHEVSLARLSANAGCAACAALVHGTATTGSLSPKDSTRMPSGNVSQMPAAHLLIVFTVAGATMIASGGGSTSGSPGFLYSLRTG